MVFSLLRFVMLLALMSMTAACGYRWGQGSAISEYRTISIPYVEGDWDGDLTAAVIKCMEQSGTLRYCDSGGALLLRIRLVDEYDENIGFRYDRSKKGHFKRRIVPVETRVTNVAEVSVVEVASGKLLMGPVRIFADIEFDHDYYSSPNGINEFSLGQLTDVEEASDAAQHPLNEVLARKIVDYVNVNW